MGWLEGQLALDGFFGKVVMEYSGGCFLEKPFLLATLSITPLAAVLITPLSMNLAYLVHLPGRLSHLTFDPLQAKQALRCSSTPSPISDLCRCP